MLRGHQTASTRCGRRAATAFGFALCLLAAAVPAPAAAAPKDLEARLKLEGSNDFRVTITGGAYSSFRVARVEARRGGRITSYGTVREVTLDRDEFAAKLGPIGSFDLRFEPRQARMIDGNPRCGNGRARVVSGVFTGTVELRGEHDFTTVETTRVTGSITRSGLGYCRKRRPEPRLEDPVSLSACRSDGPRAASGLIALADSPPGAKSAIWGALRFERLAGLFVTRYVVRRAPGSTFAFTRGDFTSAELSPPAPFAGTASYELFEDEDGNDSGRLTGDLSVGFAGAGGHVPIAPTEPADFGPRKSGWLDCAFGIAPASRRAALAPAPSALTPAG
jgi:hypothetical protein